MDPLILLTFHLSQIRYRNHERARNIILCRHIPQTPRYKREIGTLRNPVFVRLRECRDSSSMAIVRNDRSLKAARYQDFCIRL